MNRGGGKRCLRVHHDEAVSTRVSCIRSLSDVCADGQRSSCRRVAREVVADPSAKRAGCVLWKDGLRCVRHSEDFLEASIHMSYGLIRL